MKARVTITLDPATHRQAKRVARLRRTTVSGLIEKLLRSIGSRPKPGSLVTEMIGSAKLRSPRPGSDPLYDALKKKYL
ncbi:MAG TPA: DUF6364 family protein [Chthoniobacterales bacterium]|nr:DUF6364 family protein [Chthoniobacterales bacterium]